MMKVIETEDQYEGALARIYNLMQIDFEEGSREYDELGKLSIVFEEYEKINCYISE